MLSSNSKYGKNNNKEEECVIKSVDYASNNLAPFSNVADSTFRLAPIMFTILLLLITL